MHVRDKMKFSTFLLWVNGFFGWEYGFGKGVVKQSMSNQVYEIDEIFLQKSKIHWFRNDMFELLQLPSANVRVFFWEKINMFFSKMSYSVRSA